MITRGKVKLSEGILHVFLAAIVMLNPADLDQVCIESQGILRGFFSEFIISGQSYLGIL